MKGKQKNNRKEDRYLFQFGHAKVCLLSLIAFLVTASSCSKQSTSYYPDECWQMYACPNEAGWSAEALERADFMADSIGTAAYMLVYQGAVVHTYGDMARRYRCHSIRKSILSSLYGIYIDEGAIDLDEDMKSIGIDRIDSLMGYELNVKVRNLLTCTSGIYHPGASETKGMMEKRPVRLSQPDAPPFYYNNWDFNTLGSIFNMKVGQDIFDAFSKRIAEPLKMQDFRSEDGFYEHDPEHSGSPEYKFKLSTRDLARFGLLFMEEGRWKDQQVITEDWVLESTSKKLSLDERYGIDGFGYCWWTMGAPFDQYGGFLASGFHGHRLIILPTLDLVFVHRMDTYTKDNAGNEEIFSLLGMLLNAQEGQARSNPDLTSLPETHVEVYSPVSPIQCMQLSGEYTAISGKRLTLFCKGDTLWMKDALAGNYRLFPLEEGVFRVEDMEQELIVEQDHVGEEPLLQFHETYKKCIKLSNQPHN